MSTEPDPVRFLSGLPGRILLGSLALWASAWAITKAIQLIICYWQPLLAVVVVIGLVAAAIAWWQTRHQGW